MGNSQKNNVTVCIIIPHLNEKKMILDLLTSLEKKTDFDNYITVVVDNGSRDGSASAIQTQFPKVRIIRNEINLGFSKAVNQAMKVIPAKYYFLLNNDCLIIQSDWLSRLVKIMENNPDLGILGTKEISPHMVSTYLQKIKENRISNEYFPKKFICYGQVIIRSEVFSTIGLLDEDYSPAFVEDLDHCYRALRYGWKMAEIPSIRIVHLGRVTGKKLLSYTDYLILRHRILYTLYNFRLHRVFVKISYLYLYMISRSIAMKKSHVWLYYTPKVFWFLIKNWFAIIKKRIRRLKNLAYTTPIDFK